MTEASTMQRPVEPEPDDDPRTERRARQYRNWVAATSRPLDVLAFIFLAAFLANRLVEDGPDWWKPFFAAISLLIWLAFAIDYVVRLSLAPKRWPFVQTHKLDLLMVLLPMLRILRVVLLLRKSIRSISMEKIAGSLFTIVAVVVATGAILEWKVEHNAPGASITTLGTAFWWAIVTTTTVGYGDTYPVTPAGRLIASVIMVVGIGLIGTVSATVAAWFVSHRQQMRDDELQAKKVARRRRLLARRKPRTPQDGPSSQAGPEVVAAEHAGNAEPAARKLSTDTRSTDTRSTDTRSIDTRTDDSRPGVARTDSDRSSPDRSDIETATAAVADADLVDVSLADADLTDGSVPEELIELQASLIDAVAVLTAQIRDLTAQQEALRASISLLVDQRSR